MIQPFEEAQLYATINKPEFETKAIQDENKFFVDTRFPSQKTVDKTTFKKQALPPVIDYHFQFPLKGNVAYDNNVFGINTKEAKREFIKRANFAPK
jgi:hypothetical protein